MPTRFPRPGEPPVTISRRRLVSSAAAAAACLAARSAASQEPRRHRVGYLAGPDSPGERTAAKLRASFLDGLRERGYVEGRNLEIQWRVAGPERTLDELATELVRLEPDVVVSTDDEAHAALKRATATVPVVMAMSSDPVRDGLVASFTRPAGNITGLAWDPGTLARRRLELLREMVSGLSRVAFLLGPDTHGSARVTTATTHAARSLALTLRRFEVRRSGELPGVFAAIAADRPEAVVLGSQPLVHAERRRIAELASLARLPTLAPSRDFVEAGALMSYGLDLRDLWRRAAFYVARILQGARAGELPVERPTRFELVVSFATARVLDLAIPSAVLLRADHVLQ